MTGMPELPEVETTRRGIKPHVGGRQVARVIVRNGSLRWPVPTSLSSKLKGRRIESVERRGKYILLNSAAGTVLVHLGMSGSLRIVDASVKPEKHDHVDIILDNGKCLRFRDPRRFGCILWAGQSPLEHKLLRTLGPEPLDDDFNADSLYLPSRGRSQAIKLFIMDSHNVVGVGNIYASEALYLSGINPRRAAGRVSHERYRELVAAIKAVLSGAIERGGTTLRDFVNSEGSPGYFAQELNVYGKANEACNSCDGKVRQIVQGQRSTFYCPRCQT